MTDLYGNVSYNSVTTGTMYPFIYADNSSALSFASINGDMTLRSDTGTAASTVAHYHFTDMFTYTSSSDDDNPNNCTTQDGGYDPEPPVQVRDCEVPDAESTHYARQALTIPEVTPTASDFLQTLSTSGNDDGSKVTEGTTAVGNDGCYFTGSAIPPQVTVTGGQWVIGQISPGVPESQVVIPGHNQWGPDTVGFSTGAVRYYQQQRAMRGLTVSCQTVIHQQMTIQCEQSSESSVVTVYAVDDLTLGIDATGTVNCRAGVCSPHTNYQ